MFLKTQLFKAISFGSPLKLPFSYWILVFLRFLLVLLPQRGYIHPDEFFQNIEIIAGDVLVMESIRPWEFDPKFPVRNILVPKMVLGPPLHFIRLANPYTKYYLNLDLKTSYFLLVIPRLFICSLSLINDYCLYKICTLYGQNFRNRLVIFASSYVIFIHSTRTFSNTFEMILFSILLYLVAQCMLKSDKVIYHNEFLCEKYKQAQTVVERVKLYKLKTHLPEHSFNNVIILSTLVVVGIFNRPTFIVFAFPPIFFWFHRGLGSKVVGFKDFHYRILIFILCGIPSLVILILIDSIYYGYLTSADVESLKISWNNWVVTPLNFLRYNMDRDNLSKHGIHPRWLHAVVNVPLLFNVLGVLGLYSVADIVYRFTRGQYARLPRIQSISGLMLFSLVIPVALLSLFPHQEPRFIIPVILPLVYLFGNYLFPNEGDPTKFKKFKKVLRMIWYSVNAIFVLFYGFIHQAGIYPFASSLAKEIKSVYGVQTHVMLVYSYSMPEFLLQLESTTHIWKDKLTGHAYKLAPSTFIRNYGSLSMDDLFTKIDDTLSQAEKMLHDYNKKYRFYVASPCSLEKDIREKSYFYHHIDLIEERSFYPHFSSEAFPLFPSNRDQYCVTSNLKNESQVIDLNMFQRVSCYLQRFCFRVYAVKAKHYKV